MMNITEVPNAEECPYCGQVLEGPVVPTLDGGYERLKTTAHPHSCDWCDTPDFHCIQSLALHIDSEHPEKSPRCW